MSKGHAMRTPGGAVEYDSIQDSMTALMKEAQLQQNQGRAMRHTGGHLLAGGANGRPRRRERTGSMLPESLQPLLLEAQPTRRLDDLILQPATRAEIRDLLIESAQSDLLRSHSLEPRHTVLLVGPPGTGKTSLASAIAVELALPFLTVRYDGLVGSYLGETASRLQLIVDYVARTPCVLFFDEFESVGKERADAHETGEIKRVVSSLLLHMDALPSHCLVVCATNHPELLDRAVWRRFEVRVELPAPGRAELKQWFLRTSRSFGDLGMSADAFVDLFTGETLSEVEAITLDARRNAVLSHGEMTPAAAFDAALQRWERRRKVSGRALGAGTVRTNRPRAAKGKSDQGAQGTFSEGNLL